MKTEKDNILEFVVRINEAIKPFTITADSLGKEGNDRHFTLHGPENAYVNSACGVNVTSHFHTLVEIVAKNIWRNKNLKIQCNNTGTIFWFYDGEWMVVSYLRAAGGGGHRGV